MYGISLKKTVSPERNFISPEEKHGNIRQGKRIRNFHFVLSVKNLIFTSKNNDNS